MLERSVDRIVFRRFTVSAARVLLLAESEAMRLGHPTVRVAHLLLGLVLEGEGRAAQALTAAGVDLGRARSAVEQTLGTGSGEGGGIEGYSDDLLAAIEWALVEALASGGGSEGGEGGEGGPAGTSDEQIDTEELLLGVLRLAERHDGVADGVLAALGTTSADVRRALGDLPPAAADAPDDQPSDQGEPAEQEGREGDDDPGGEAPGPGE
jgi:ATP-dependent Clp protease ATP-binding subunit ClpC